MEHKVVAAASMITALKTQHSPSKCKTNCLSLTKRSPQTPVTAFQLCRWPWIKWRSIFRAMLQVVCGCSVYPQNELGRESWGEKPVRTNVISEKLGCCKARLKILAPALKLGTLMHDHLLDPSLCVSYLWTLMFYVTTGLLFQSNQSLDWNFLGVKSTDYVCLFCSEMKHLLGWGGTLQLGNCKERDERKTAHSSSKNRSEEACHTLGWQVWTSRRELSCFPHSTSLNCGTSSAAVQDWGKNGQKCMGVQPGELNVIVQSP